MTLFAYLNGSEVGVNIRLNGFGLSSSADGSVGVGGIVFDDPAGTLDVRGWMKVVVKELACTSAPVLFSGYIFDRTYSRSDSSFTYKYGSGRFIDCNLLDENAVMHVRLITGLDGKRPAETRSQRLAWLLGSAYLGSLIDDTSLVSSGAENFEEASYLGQYADDVLSDISAPINRIFFVYLTQPAGERGLFFDRATETIQTSTLTISNVETDVSRDANGLVTGTCYPPSIDAQLNRDPSEVYDNIRYTYKNGTILGHDNTTKATFFTDNGLGSRGIQIDNSRVGQESTARTFAARILDRDSTEADTLTVTIQLPPSKAGLIQAGDRIGVRFTHLEGYATQVFSRITSRTIAQTDGNDQLYDVTLTLNTKGLPGGGGGGAPGPGTFPHPPGSTPSIVQQIAAFADISGQVTLPADPTLGNTLVLFITKRAGATTLAPGWTEHSHGGITPGSDGAKMAYRAVSVSDTAAILVAASNAGWCQIWEVEGDVTPTQQSFTDVDTLVEPATVNPGTVTTADPALILAGICVHCSDWGGNGDNTIGNDASFTTDAKHEISDIPDTTGPFTADTTHPLTWSGHLNTTAAGTFGPTLALTSESMPAFNFAGWGGLQMAFEGTAITANPPQPGQWVYDETPTPAPGGGRVTFFTAFPFSDGSLQVFVDNVEQTAAIASYDGAAGSFTLAFDPRSWETLLVNYQGR